ncbi:16S rRNA (guanine(966)-N(2))-methyltransferase RsmD [Terriglobus albidus]|uniref:16S rRNA (guanine(966)-N(2))-methyltransferase RsmD n=1 Tax=Terriglobus albidus TaxID=1592106 RepID=UPI0021E09E55|nr:16S rRNA (guanine(966)-N(2))-methyltransferase RsmD [Terriglobus albidus]
MRIIGGKWRSRQIAAPKSEATRPTSDRLRETLFNVLGQDCTGLRVLDLYAGSGAVGLEALSRGARRVWFAEKSSPALATLRANLRALGAEGAVVDNSGVSTLLSKLAREKTAIDLIFLDPPWDMAQEYERTLGFLGSHEELLNDGARVVAEHRSKVELPARVGNLERTRVLKQGDASLSFYQWSDEGDTTS